MSPERAQPHIKCVAELLAAKVKNKTLNDYAVEGLIHSRALSASDYAEDVLPLFKLGMAHYNQELNKP